MYISVTKVLTYLVMAKPTNPKLYARIKAKVKARVKKWPSAYASGQLVREYKAAGGGYSLRNLLLVK